MSPPGLPWIHGLVLSAKLSSSKTVCWRAESRSHVGVARRRVQRWNSDNSVRDDILHGRTLVSAIMEREITRQSSPCFSRNKTWMSQLCFPLVSEEPLLTSRCLDSKGEAEQLSSLPSPHTNHPQNVHFRFTPHAASFTPDICLFTPPLALFTRTSQPLTPDTCLFTPPLALFTRTINL
jgi:hypothetical protein